MRSNLLLLLAVTLMVTAIPSMWLFGNWAVAHPVLSKSEWLFHMTIFVPALHVLGMSACFHFATDLE